MLCRCGWGSVSLYLAEMFPNSKITAFSNSRTQKIHIDEVAKEKGFGNLRVITGDVKDYEFEHDAFDRVISVEMIGESAFALLSMDHLSRGILASIHPQLLIQMTEHTKNHELLLAKVSRALVPGGKFFVHIFTHKTTPYDFDGGWMTEHFFTGGTMPSADLLLYFQRDLKIKQQWWVNGMHYGKTCEDWLTTMLSNEKSIKEGLKETYGEEGVTTWWNRWQVFYLACAELFKWEGGDTWGVSHYLFEKPE